MLRSSIALLATVATVMTLAPVHAAADELVDHPVLDLSFEGNLSDAASAANSVTFKGHNGSTTTRYHWVDGVAPGTQALQLDGDTYLDLGSSTSLQPQDLTLSFWLNPSSTMGGEQIIGWNKSGFNSDGWYLSSESNTSPLALSIGPASGQPYKVRVASADRAGFFPAGQWTHIAVTYDHATKDVTFYRNGEQVQSSVASPFGVDGATGVLGSDPALPKTIGFNGPIYNGSYLTAALDQYRLFNGVADIGDVVHLYERDSGRQIDRQAVAQSDADGLSLPEQITVAAVLATSGSRGSTIEWSSSDPAVIGTDGSVNRPAEGEADAQVTLTARVHFLDGPVVTRDFTVSVPAAQPTGTLDESGLDTILLSDDYLNNAAAKEHDYLLSLSSEKFLYEFYRVAGLPPTTDSGYGGWERSDVVNFRGHAFGHYMSALAMSYAGSRDPQTKAGLLAQISAAVNGLEQVQDAYGAAHPASAGYVSAFKESALDAVQGTGTTDDNVIVPWYNLHKVLAGLLDIAEYAPAEQSTMAKQIAEQFGEYIYRRVAALPDKSTLLRTEYGGMNEALYELFAISGGNPHFKVAAEAFDEVTLFRNLAAGRDVLAGLHANTTIPKFIGALKRYTVFTQNPQYYAMLTEQEKADLPMYLTAAQNFFDVVVQHHTYATGSNSQSEHFHAGGLLYSDAQEMGEAGNATTSETCNEYNMLKLARELLRLTKDVKYANYYENTFINTILASQNPETGMTTYFQPMGPGYEKVFGLPFTEFWCCIGTGMENFSKLGDSMYYTGENSVYVTMFFSSTFEHQARNLKLSQEAHLPNNPTVKLTVDSLDGGPVAAGTSLRLRVPDWIAGAPTLKVNGAAVNPAISGGYVILPDIAKGDQIEYTMPMKVAAIATADNPDFVAFKYGPTILSTSLGKNNIGATDPQGIGVRISRLDPNAQTIITVKGGTVEGWKANLEQNVVRIPDAANGDVQFKLQNTADAADLTFTPHFKRYNERYGLYLNLEEPDSPAAQDRIRKVKEQQRTDEVSIDTLTTFDNNNAEAGKNVKSSGSGVGTFSGRTYRDAGPGGWFSYNLQIDPTKPKNYLAPTFYSGDQGRTFDVYVNDEKLKTVIVNNGAGTNVFYDDVTEIPSKWLTIDDSTRYRQNSAGEFVLDANGNKIPVVTVRFQSTGGLVGGLFGIRTLRTTSYDTDARLSGLTFDNGTLTPQFAPDTNRYTLTVPAGTTSVALDADPHVPSGLVWVDGILVDDTAPRPINLPEDGGTKTVALTGYAQDHTTSTTYTVDISTQASTPTDTTAPVTTASTDPARPASGYYTGPVTLTLAAQDEDGGSGVDSTSYAIDGGAATQYSAPFQIIGDGTHVVSYFTADQAGNTEAAKSLEVTIDATRPTVTGELTGRSVTVTAADSGSGIDNIEYRIDNGDWVVFTSPVGAPDASAHTVSFRATDKAGNVSDVGSVQVPVHGEKVQVSVTSAGPPSADGWYRQNVLVALAAPTGSSGLVVQARVNGAAWKNNPKAITVSANGSTLIEYRLLRSNVLVAGSEGQITIKLDKVAPAVSLVRSPAGGTGSPRNPIDVRITGADALSGVGPVEYRINDGAWTPVGADPVRFNQVGQYVLTARVTDLAGNVSQEKSSNVVIAADPATQLTASPKKASAGAPVTFNLKGFLRYDTVTLEAGGVSWGTVTTDVNGTAKVTVTVPAATTKGDVTITITATGADPAITASTTLTVK